jgi:hypothetical protein
MVFYYFYYFSRSNKSNIRFWQEFLTEIKTNNIKQRLKNKKKRENKSLRIPLMFFKNIQKQVSYFLTFPLFLNKFMRKLFFFLLEQITEKKKNLMHIWFSSATLKEDEYVYRYFYIFRESFFKKTKGENLKLWNFLLKLLSWFLNWIFWIFSFPFYNI